MVGDTISVPQVGSVPIPFMVTNIGPGGVDVLSPNHISYTGQRNVSDFTLLSRAPSATPGEERFASGAYWESSDPMYTDVVVSNPINKGESGAWCIAFNRKQTIRAQRNVEVERSCRTYRGNVADQVERFLIALTRAADVAMHRVCEPRNDTLPSPAPTGSFIAGGVEYDEIPSRYGEADEDAVFKKQAARFAKLREEEAAALERFERISREVSKQIARQAPTATVSIDKSRNGNALVHLFVGGEKAQLYMRSENDVGISIAGALQEIRYELGARAMRGGK